MTLAPSKQVSALALLHPSQREMVGRGVSTIAASRDLQMRPSIMRAVGCVLEDDGISVTIFLWRPQSRQLLQDLAATGHIAVVFSEPISHRTVQLKALKIEETRAATEADKPALARYLRSMQHEIGLIGFPPAYTNAMLHYAFDELVAVRFVPTLAYDQTPGPKAGSDLAAPPAGENAVASRPAGTSSAAGGVPVANVADASGSTASTSAEDRRTTDRRRAPQLSTLGAHAVPLNAIRQCLEGIIPAVMATCSADGVPNVAYISQAYYMDERHIAQSFQFFNKTRANILANPVGTALVLDPATMLFYRLQLHYLHTETSGPLFEGMKAQLAGIASYSGMAEVFKLLGADVYEVQTIERLDGAGLPPAPPRHGLLNVVRRASEAIARSTGLDELLSGVLARLADDLDVHHAMVLMLDREQQRLYTVASAGYATSGVGSEIAVGDGVIGVCARECTPVRIMHMTHAELYSNAICTSLRAATWPGFERETTIPYPGLPAPHSQLAVPISATGRLLGVLFVESPRDLSFNYEDEDMLVAIAGQLGAAIELVQAPEPAGRPPDAVAAARAAQPATESAPEPGAPVAAGPALHLRRFRVNDSVFIDDTYLIKGVAGAILWKLLRDYTCQGRTEFSNRELRLDPTIRLPDVADNLEARLVLLQRRLVENSPHIRIEKTGRGKFRLLVLRPVELEEVAA